MHDLAHHGSTMYHSANDTVLRLQTMNEIQYFGGIYDTFDLMYTRLFAIKNSCCECCHAHTFCCIWMQIKYITPYSSNDGINCNNAQEKKWYQPNNSSS